MYCTALAVTEHLHFNMAAVLHKRFHVKAIISEGCFGLPCTGLVGRVHVFSRLDNAHAPATTTGDSLDNNSNIAPEAGHEFPDLFLSSSSFGSGYYRNVTVFGQPSRCNFVPKRIQCIRVGPDECDAVFVATTSQLRVFTEETVTGMQSIRPRFPGSTNDGINIQICACALAGQKHSKISMADVE